MDFFSTQLEAGDCNGPEQPSLNSAADLRSFAQLRGWDGAIYVSSTANDFATADRTVTARLSSQMTFSVDAPFSFLLGAGVGGTFDASADALTGSVRLLPGGGGEVIASLAAGAGANSTCGLLPAGAYRLEVLDFGIDQRIAPGTDVSKSAQVFAWFVIDRLQPLAYGDAPTAVACPGGTVRLTGNTDRYGVYTYRWRHNGVPLDVNANPTAATNTLLIQEVTGSDEGSYDCEIGSECVQTVTPATRLLVDPADLGSAGGVTARDGLKDNNDFIVFIDLFFARDPRADLGSAGSVLGSDGLFDNNDFIRFIDLFFAGC